MDLRDGSAAVSGAVVSVMSRPAKPLRVSVDGRGLGLSITAESAARFLLAQASPVEHLRSSPSISN
jgi:hypothetical protein